MPVLKQVISLVASGIFKAAGYIWVYLTGKKAERLDNAEEVLEDVKVAKNVRDRNRKLTPAQRRRMLKRDAKTRSNK